MSHGEEDTLAEQALRVTFQHFCANGKGLQACIVRALQADKDVESVCHSFGTPWLYSVRRAPRWGVGFRVTINKRTPRTTQLAAGVETFVFDVQGRPPRFVTNVSTYGRVPKAVSQREVDGFEEAADFIVRTVGGTPGY